MPFTKGDPNINRSGRPLGSGGGLKDYDRQKFQAMTPEQKDIFLRKLSPELRYKMAEGNPANATDFTTDGQPLNIIFDPTFNESDKTSRETEGSNKEPSKV